MPDTPSATAPAPRFDPSSVEAVVFDIGGVFLYPHPDQASGALRKLGVAAPTDAVEYQRAHHAGVAALSLATFEPKEDDTTTWIAYDRAYLSSLGADPDIVLEFRDCVVRREWDWLHDANVAAFHKLHASGMPLAIVSNNSGAAPEQMRNNGVCWVSDWAELPRVAAIIDSSLVGVAKPDPAIMTPALHALGLPADRVLYVGDTVHADINGATNAGMQSVQLDPFDHHTSYDHARVPDLAALNQTLAI